MALFTVISTLAGHVFDIVGTIYSCLGAYAMGLWIGRQGGCNCLPCWGADTGAVDEDNAGEPAEASHTGLRAVSSREEKYSGSLPPDGPKSLISRSASCPVLFTEGAATVRVSVGSWLSESKEDSLAQMRTETSPGLERP